LKDILILCRINIFADKKTYFSALYQSTQQGEIMQLFQFILQHKISNFFKIGNYYHDAHVAINRFKLQLKKQFEKKFTIIFFSPNEAKVKQYHIPAVFNLLLKISAGALLTFSLALILHTLYLANYIKTHEAQFARVDQLESELKKTEMEIAALTKKNADITSAELPSIIAFENQAIDVLKDQVVSYGTLSRGNDSRGRSLEEIAAQDDLSLADHEKLLQLIYDTAINNAQQLAHIPSILPLKGSTYITSPYGYRRNPFGGRSSEFHDGVDFAASYGTPVYATADGVVSFAGWDYGYGRKIVINHGNGIITFYGHNSKFLVSAGTEVKKGELIAYSGNSGRSSGPHLHYGASLNGQSINPLTFTNK